MRLLRANRTLSAVSIPSLWLGIVLGDSGPILKRAGVSKLSSLLHARKRINDFFKFRRDFREFLPDNCSPR